MLCEARPSMSDVMEAANSDPRERGLAGQRVLITGAGVGIGAETARLLVSLGAKVGLLDRNGEAARRMAGELGVSAVAISGDVTEPDVAERALHILEATFGGIDALINNAGTWDHGPLVELTPERWQRVLDVNLMAPIELSRRVVPRMQPGSAIVNVSSVLGQVAAPTRGPYCVSKAALIALTKMQAVEWAERGIRVNAIAPGYIMNETTAAMAAAGSFDTAAIDRRTPLGRFGSEREVAEGIAFLIDPVRAAYVTGHVLEVSGGWTAYGYV
jgi:NAD(P)-dependent dehydrogenase (short-subunit alcohol dehydrogenase family)